MKVLCSRRALLASIFPPLAALTFAASGAATVGPGAAARQQCPDRQDRLRRASAVSPSPAGYAFRGLPYAAAPTGDLRWRAPRPPASWQGVRDATQYAAELPAAAEPVRAARPVLRGLPLPQRLHADAAPRRRRPVLVWIHGGGFTQDAGRNYDGTKLAADGHRRRHDQLPAGRARLPRPPGARLAARWPGRQLRPDGPAGGAALGTGTTSRRSAAIRTTSRSPASRPAAWRCSPTWSRAAPAGSSSGRSWRAARSRSTSSRSPTPRPSAGVRRRGGLPGPDGDVPASRCRSRARRQVPGRRDPRRRRRQGPHGVDRDGARRRALRPRADHQRHQPRRGAALRPGLHVAVSGGTFVAGTDADPRDLRERRSPPCSACPAARATGDRGRVPAQLPTIAGRGAQHAGRRRELRVPGAAGRPLDVQAGADLRLPVQRRQRAPALRTARRADAADRDALVRDPVPVRPAEHAGSRDARCRPGEARRHDASRVGDVRRDRQPVDESSAVAVVQRRLGACCRSSRRSHSSRRTSLRHTTARSGPPDGVSATDERGPWPPRPLLARRRRATTNTAPTRTAGWRSRSSSPPGS